MRDIRVIEAVARQVRAEFAAGCADPELLGSLYLAYNPNVEIVSYLRGAAKSWPNWNCGLASVYLRYLLGEGEVLYLWYKLHRHTFLLLSGDLIVDVTADQYGGPTIYVSQLVYPWSKTRPPWWRYILHWRWPPRA